jgi:hypothetical protein
VQEKEDLPLEPASISEKISDNKNARVLFPADEQPEIAIVNTGFAITALPNT